jgi:prephenate dehydrogenase
MPYYLDAVEHDGLVAATEQVPLLVALGLQLMADASPSRREMIQLSGADFATTTQLLAGEADRLAELCALNATNVTRWLDAFLPQLSRIRDHIANEDSKSLQESFASALKAHDGWSRKRLNGETVDYSELGARQTMLGGAFGPRRKTNE